MKTNFLVRKRKLTPNLFLDLLFYGIDSEVKSLRRISNAAYEEHSIAISKQAIHRRFSASCVDFIKVLIGQSLSSQVTTSIDPSELQLFKRVRIKDSTRFGVQDSLAGMFDGYGKGGGRSSKAGVSIQYEFDIKTHRVLDIDLQPAVARDCTDAVLKREDIQKGDLLIRDLGYYSDKVLERTILSEAFVVSRLYQTANIYDQKQERIDFQRVYHHMVNTQTKYQDLDVLIGHERRPVRLIVELLPEEVYQKRVVQRTKENRTRGYNVSDEYKGRAHFNLFITNIDRSACSCDCISKLYRVRWQVELVFKIWKSILNIDKLKACSNERFLAMLYAKLLWIFINWKIIADCRSCWYIQYNRLLSLNKCFQTTSESSGMMRAALMHPESIGDSLAEIIRKLQEGHWLEKRKKRQNFEELLLLLFCKSNT